MERCELITGILEVKSFASCHWTLADTGSDGDSNMKLRSPQYRQSVSAKESSVFCFSSSPQVENRCPPFVFFILLELRNLVYRHHIAFSQGQKN